MTYTEHQKEIVPVLSITSWYIENKQEIKQNTVFHITLILYYLTRGKLSAYHRNIK